MKPRCFESGLHCTSLQSPPQATSSQSVDRCWSGGIFSRITFGWSTSMMTRSIVVTSLSPGSGYFQASSFGCPTWVLTRYISPSFRWSCWKVATFFESGAQRTIGRSVRSQPALSVA